MNAEFQKNFSTSEITPILRNLETNRYWINENLLIVDIHGMKFNIAQAILAIIDEYVKAKQDSFQRFIKQCEVLQDIENKDVSNVHAFIVSLLAPNVDARLFEIVKLCYSQILLQSTKHYLGIRLGQLEGRGIKAL